ncbi:MAG TPA: cytochrome c biogenesis protein CcsA, partial [Acidimicrobiia bacterium]|nr:cytochrome c biogenesis protein CcsA [Acidimicrobiia bacterium]
TQTTSLATPWPYRLSALWGGMDGSMLFYTALTLAVATLGLKSSVGVRVGSVVALGLALVTILYANPFFVPDIPAVDGEGLLAILQHPAMIYHPPILYLGLVVLIMPFAHTVELVLGRVDRFSWRAATRRWLYISWTLLTVGMAAGANWAYVELGWGGYWAWDPVENTALMPWLAATVFLHSSRLEESGGRARRWNVLFAGLPFALSVLGIYLTRSGVTGSIHSFAENPVAGRILLTSAGVAALLAGALAVRSQRGESWGSVRLDRAGWFGINSILIAAALLFVTIGSAYPAFVSVFTDRTVVVDSHFFAATVFPIAVLVALSLAFSLRSVRPGLYMVAWVLVALVTTSVVGIRLVTILFAFAFVSLLLVGVWVLRRLPKGRLVTAHLAHLGLAVVLVGVAGSSLGDQFEGSMTVGDTVVVSGHEVTLEEVTIGEAGRFLFVRARFDVDGNPLTPEIRAYEDQDLPVSEPALRSTPIDDVIVAPSLLFPDGETVAVSVFVRPLVWWVWVGGALIGLAGLAALFWRDGAGAVPHRPARATLLSAGTTSDSASR